MIKSNNINPNIDNFIEMLNKYGKNTRINSINALQNLPKKSKFYKIMRSDIPPERAIIDSINLNKLLKNLILLTSDESCPLGDYNEYMRYKEIYDQINKDEPDEKLKNQMLIQIENKMKEYSIENEFKTEKSLHNYVKKMFLFLITNSFESNEFYKDVVSKIKGNKSGIYVAPSVNTYNHDRFSYNRTNNIYQPPTIMKKQLIDDDNFINISNIQKCPSIDDKELFPILGSIKK